MIDYIHYIATTTSASGTALFSEGWVFVPFIDYLLVLTVIWTTVLLVWFFYYILYPNREVYRKK